MQWKKNLTRIVQIRLLAALATALIRRAPGENRTAGEWMRAAAYTAAAFCLVSQREGGPLEG